MKTTRSEFESALLSRAAIGLPGWNVLEPVLSALGVAWTDAWVWHDFVRDGQVGYIAERYWAVR